MGYSSYATDGRMIPRVPYSVVSELRGKLEALADHYGFELSSFLLEEYPGSDWQEPMEIKVSLKQLYERTEEDE